MKTRRTSWWSWLWAILGALYFFVPMYGTLDFSLKMERDKIGLLAYETVLSDPAFVSSFAFSLQMAVITILVSVALFVPTVYWIHLRLPKLRPVVELITLLPFIIPTIVLVFGLIRTFSRRPFLLTLTPLGTDVLLIAGYVILSMPYMYRAVDVGLRAIDVHTLTEAALSLGASWPDVILRVIVPNLRVAILSGALITFATVIGELILADFLVRPALGPYMVVIGEARAYEPAALGILSFGLTWAAMGLIQYFARGDAGRQLTVR
ncbi:MAG: ABC transporter permease subunit [Anaerolineales bacterium]|nr:ABC transporter permease subunit [Anaerolineales bacterium]